MFIISHCPFFIVGFAPFCSQFTLIPLPLSFLSRFHTILRVASVEYSSEFGMCLPLIRSAVPQLLPLTRISLTADRKSVV